MKIVMLAEIRIDEKRRAILVRGEIEKTNHQN